MTKLEILAKVRERKQCSEGQCRRYMRELGIQHVGCRQKPLIYPDDSAEKILRYLGFTPQPATTEKLPVKLARLAKLTPSTAVVKLNGHRVADGSIPSLRKLQSARSKPKAVK